MTAEWWGRERASLRLPEARLWRSHWKSHILIFTHRFLSDKTKKKRGGMSTLPNWQLFPSVNYYYFFNWLLPCKMTPLFSYWVGMLTSVIRVDCPPACCEDASCHSNGRMWNIKQPCNRLFTPVLENNCFPRVVKGFIIAWLKPRNLVRFISVLQTFAEQFQYARHYPMWAIRKKMDMLQFQPSQIPHTNVIIIQSRPDIPTCSNQTRGKLWEWMWKNSVCREGSELV